MFLIPIEPLVPGEDVDAVAPLVVDVEGDVDLVAELPEPVDIEPAVADVELPEPLDVALGVEDPVLLVPPLTAARGPTTPPATELGLSPSLAFAAAVL